MPTQTGAEHLNLPVSEILKAKDKKITELEKQVEELRQALASQKANEESESKEHIKKEDDDSEDGGDVVMDQDEDDSDSEMTPYIDLEPEIEGEPLWVLDEHLYRCSVCATEIVERRCEGCNRSYKNWICEETPDSEPIDKNYLDLVYQKRENEDYRMAEERETTPVRDINNARLHPDTVAYDYGDRVEEYKSLLARGATRMMCETFHLSYSQETGIWLEIKDDLLQEWAGPKILKPEGNPASPFVSWKICLGREIVLDEADEDGSVYVDEFLEEALLFGGRTGGTLAWRTVEANPGEWVTKPFRDAASAPDHTAEVREWFEVAEYLGYDDEWEHPEQVAKNEYESDNSGDEEEGNDSDGMAQLGWDGEGGYGPDGDRSDEEAQMSDPAPESEGDESIDSDWDSEDDEDDEDEDM